MKDIVVVQVSHKFEKFFQINVLRSWFAFNYFICKKLINEGKKYW